MNRKAVFATVAIQLATLCAGEVCDAQAASATSASVTPARAEILTAALERLGRAMAGGTPRQSAPDHNPPAESAALATALPSAAKVSESSPCADRALPIETVRQMVEDEAVRQRVDVKLALAIAAQESSFGAHVNSSAAAAAGAMGVMQLMPETAAHYGVADRCDIAENIRGGVALDRELSARFGANVFLILAAYNAGEKRVFAARGVPPIQETVRYVASAANAYYDFPNILDSARRSNADGAKAPAADPAALQADSVGQKWIGGSVLYVEQEK